MKNRLRKNDGIPETIGFRLDEVSQKVLSARAKVLGVSAHELARHYVSEMLGQGEEREALREAILTLHGELHALSERVMISVEALLTSAGKVEKIQAQAWVRKTFGKE